MPRKTNKRKKITTGKSQNSSKSMFTRRNLMVGVAALSSVSLLAFRQNEDINLMGHIPNVDADSVDLSLVDDMMIGSPDAPVTMIEYASFTCGHCARFHADIFKSLKRDYIDTGKVKFVFREVYFDRQGLWASMLARCAGPEMFFGVTDLLFSKQSDWAIGNGADAIEQLKEIGLLTGLSEVQVAECFDDAKMAETLVAWYQSNATKDNITATPSFLINGRPQRNTSYQELRKTLDLGI